MQQSWLNNPNAGGMRAKAYERLFTLFGMPGKVDTPEMRASIGKYGLGSKRTLEQYQEYVGVNLTTLEVSVGVNAKSILMCLCVMAEPTRRRVAAHAAEET